MELRRGHPPYPGAADAGVSLRYRERGIVSTLATSIALEPATAAPTQSTVRGRAVGAMFFAGFGSIWLYTGLRGLHRASPASLAALTGLAAILVALIFVVLRRAQNLSAEPEPQEQELRAERMFTAVNIIQWVSIATAVVTLSILQLPGFIVPAISIIVGLHLFPIAGSFHFRQHYVTGALLIAWPLGCMALFPRDRVASPCAVGAGVVLMLSAASTLLQCLTALRGPAGLPARG